MHRFAPFILCLLCVGCQFLHSKTEKLAPDGTREITTATSYSLWDSQGQLLRFRNTTGGYAGSNNWVSGTSIGSLNQEASSTNINDLIGTIVGAAVKAAK